MTDTIKHFEQQTSSTLCSVLYPVHPKIKFHNFHTEQSCDRLKSDTSAAQRKNKTKQNKQKTFKKIAFRSGLPICHKL